MTRAGESARYETSDAEARPLVLAGVVLALLLALAMAASAWFGFGLSAELAAGEEASPLRELRRPSEGVELQAVPARELAAQRAWEERQLTTSAWIDPVNGIARVPIERALELSLREGFPTREERK